MTGFNRNISNLNHIFSSKINSSKRFIKSGLFSYSLEDVRNSINRYLERKVINPSSCKKGESCFPEVKQALLDLRESVNRAIEQGTEINIDDVYEAMNVCDKNLWAEPNLGVYRDIFNPLFDAIGMTAPDHKELDKQAHEDKVSFTKKEIDELYNGIVNVGDDRFYKWLRDSYPWMTDNIIQTMDLEDFMLQWIYNTPGIYKEMREWLDYWKNEED